MWYKVKLRILLKTFIQCFDYAECIAIDIFDMFGNHQSLAMND